MQKDQKVISDKDKYIAAEKLYNEGNYLKSLVLFKELLAKDTANANLNYKTGLCLTKLPLKKGEAIIYLYKAMQDISEEGKYISAIENKKAPLETPLLLAEAFLLNNETEKAQELLNDFQALIPVNNEILKSQFTNLKDQCNYVKEMITSPSNMITTALESPLNSGTDDFYPLISSDESVMIFASTRDNNQIKLFISHKTGTSWGKPEKMPATVNSGKFLPAGLSADGTRLFLCKSENGDFNLYESKLSGKNWTQPTKLCTNINSKFDETNATISSDGTLLFFTSNREGGLGGSDIYKSKKLPNGEWGIAVNMGSEINTANDEACPYIHPDGFTFFFASKGHKSLGGFDIFFCTINEDYSMSLPNNLGYPVNTTEDDLFYTPIADGKKAYYSTSNKKGLGGSDIFQISVINSSKPQAIANGYVKLENSDNANGVEVTLSDNETSEVIGKYVPNSKNGKFLIVLLPRKNHIISIEAPGYFPIINNLLVSRKSSYQETATTLTLDTFYLSKTYQMYSFEFLDLDSAVSPKVETRLAITTEYLKTSASSIEIIGNQNKLSDNRVLFLTHHLIKAGIPLTRIQHNFTAPDNKDQIEIVIFNKKDELNFNSFLLKKNYIRKLK